ncbi:hypothetical protein [Paraburkholderia tropica]|uniref:hypothetical protein n=1 Tax=Paraburkholderia tropica TaxID=92647 RepID=UPI002AB73B78|nr:hypothetical protein [Paraburkholderia tropica]
MAQVLAVLASKRHLFPFAHFTLDLSRVNAFYRVAEDVDGGYALFVSASVPDDPGARENSVDGSHRGGRAGFIALVGDALLWPEYRGNWYFNTLGNLLIDPCCGLLIPDFASGDVLQLSDQAAFRPNRSNPMHSATVWRPFVA